MESAARRKIEPKTVIAVCSVMLVALAVGFIYWAMTTNAAAEERRLQDRQACEMAAVYSGHSLLSAEVMCK